MPRSDNKCARSKANTAGAEQIYTKTEGVAPFGHIVYYASTDAKTASTIAIAA